MIEPYLIILFIILLIHYLIFIAIVFAGLKKLTSVKSQNNNSHFVSVIVPFRNESESILHCFKSLTEQDYPNDSYEIIFVDDFSIDDSLEKLLKNVNSANVKVIAVPEEYSVNAHKKRAIRYGIEKSSGEIIVTTDADCTHPNNWLSTLISFFDDKTGFVSGPVEFENGPTLFEKFQKLEFAGLVITGAGLIGSGKPTICNAANIAYRKKVYEDVGGFTYQMNLSSGDDELLMQKIKRDTGYRVEFANHHDAIVKTFPNRTVSEFYQQRKRWASKGLFYNDKFLILKLILIYLFYISLPLQLILGLFCSEYFILTFSISFILKILFEYMILKRGIKLFLDRKILKVFLPAEILHIPYIIIAGISGALGDYVWKSRKIKR